jgi:chromosome segregation ATPase
MQQNFITLIQLAQRLQNTSDPLDYDNIELPFKLVETGLKIWENLYSPQVLGGLAKADPETLDAWAIALSQTLQTQLSLLNTWLPHFSSLPVPPTLQQKIQQNYQYLGEISQQKSQLLESASTLLSQSEQLKREGEELEHLQQRQQQLNQIEIELQNTNLDELREDIQRRSQLLEPQYQELETLKQQQAELQQQQTRLDEEIERLRSHSSRQEAATANKATELITLTQTAKERLGESLTTVLEDLSQQQQDYQHTQQQLQKAIADFNRYQEETEAIRRHLNTHYQSDRQLSQVLPVDRQKIDSIISSIQQQLSELDHQLAIAQQQQAESQKKVILDFSK